MSKTSANKFIFALVFTLQSLAFLNCGPGTTTVERTVTEPGKTTTQTMTAPRPPCPSTQATPPSQELFIQGEGCTAVGSEVMPRSQALEEATIRLKAGQECAKPFDISAGGNYRLQVRYSNDNTGSLETLTINIDGTKVGSFESQNTKIAGQPAGSGWDNFFWSNFFDTINLSPGNHEIEVQVTDGDVYGIEIDAVRMERF